MAVWLSRSIARPIETVSRATSRLARGELRTRVPTLDEFHPRETRALASGFNAMADSLERYEGERKAMIADIAHELRTPLAALSMRFEALEDGLVPFDRSEIERLKGHTDLLARLVDDLRLLSLADAGRLALDLEDLDLVPWLRGAVDAFADSVGRQGARRTGGAGHLGFGLPTGGLEQGDTVTATFYDGDPDEGGQELESLSFTYGESSAAGFRSDLADASEEADFVVVTTPPQERVIDLAGSPGASGALGPRFGFGRR